MSRRHVLTLAGGGAVIVGGAAGLPLLRGTERVEPASAAVANAEKARSTTGVVVSRALRAAPARIDLGGKTVDTWAYDQSLPGSIIRVKAGDLLKVQLTNGLPAPTTIHWHGLALRNDMDGVPGLTMAEVPVGGRFDYSFVVPDPGTYWFHPHVGVQLDTGLHAPLIVEDAHESGRYDEEVVLVLDDWTDGWAESPSAVLAKARRDGRGGMAGMDVGGGMGGMGGVTAQQPLGSDTGDVTYPAHLINGRLPSAPVTVRTRPGRRIRFRLINAGADTAYRFAIGGHQLTVTHTDGYPVQPVAVDTLILGMGERYDVVVTVGYGVFPIVAVPEGKKDPAGLAVLRSASRPMPPAAARPPELNRRLLSYADLAAADGAQLGPGKPDRNLELVLTMADKGRRWLINGRTYDQHQPLEVSAGERVRLTLKNTSMMFHPMHVHGHTFAAATADGRGARKDTINVLPMQQLAVDLHTGNPGQWLIHCHNTYHAELGMMTTLSYVA